MAKKKKKVSLLKRFLSKFGGGKETAKTSKTEEELKKAGVTPAEMPSDIQRLRQQKETTRLTGKPERKVPSVSTSQAVSIAEQVLEAEKKKKKKTVRDYKQSRKK